MTWPNEDQNRRGRDQSGDRRRTAMVWVGGLAVMALLGFLAFSYFIRTNVATNDTPNSTIIRTNPPATPSGTTGAAPVR